MINRLYDVTIFHQRNFPKVHKFQYKGFAIGLDPKISIDCFPICSVSRLSLLSINPSDYLSSYSGSLQERIAQIIMAHREASSEPINLSTLQIQIVTLPRMFGYVFNPVTFYLCRFNESSLAFIAEVKNTFGGLHHYVCIPEQKTLPILMTFKKSFYVSPFFDLSGHYQIKVLEFGENINLTVCLQRPGEPDFTASIFGNGRKATCASLLFALLRHPLFVPLIMLRIHLQAAFIYFRGAGRLCPVPNTDEYQLAVSASWWFQARRRLVRFLFRS